jgi:hypothetical protein
VRVVLGRELLASGVLCGLMTGDDVDLDLELAAWEVRPARRSPRPPDRIDADRLSVAVLGTLVRRTEAPGTDPVLEVGGLCLSVTSFFGELDLPDSERVEAVGVLRARAAGMVSAPSEPAPWHVDGVEELDIMSVADDGRVDTEARELPQVPVAAELHDRRLYMLRLEGPEPDELPLFV